jgi:hypothetical protein
MTEDAPRAIRGRAAKSLPRTQRDFRRDELRVCPKCGTGLSRYNPGPLCNSCDDVYGEPTTPKIRGRVTNLPIADD